VRFWCVTTVSMMAGAIVCAGLALMVFGFHLGIRPVLTGSMRPTYGPGALLVTRSVPVESVRPGMIVVFTPPGERVQFAHRVTSVTGMPSHPVITTKGDANRAPDPWHAELISPNIPEVVTSVPWVGRLLVGSQGLIQLALIIIGGLVVLVAGTLWIMRPSGRRPAIA